MMATLTLSPRALHPACTRLVVAVLRHAGARHVAWIPELLHSRLGHLHGLPALGDEDPDVLLLGPVA
eukprot:CAMPEP_0182914146 /NCGR_PEP_ID=MMETSP0034_2-20130328/38408_1 /TAXON_ID=156128 /ORGANISM="Nephroselmis pyriformis, Strain CCMP717" /LENGTH=66 /DNA_ID=CAMNT_0025050895 /DNA_START=202 /DNA_END=398 /DNA_ORIENTATION=+